MPVKRGKQASAAGKQISNRQAGQATKQQQAARNAQRGSARNQCASAQ
jgi:hypothetical protein